MLGSGEIDRLVRSLLADEIGQQRGRAPSPSEMQSWPHALRLDEDGLGLDSLARLGAVGRLNRFFHLHETGIEDYLVVRPTLGDWVELVGVSMAKTWGEVGPDGQQPGSLTFTTSGSTGEPTNVTHAAADLLEEVEVLRGLLPGVQRIIALTPCHHVYGFLFSILVPHRLALPVTDGQAWAPGGAAKRCEPGDLIVATPFIWDLAIKAGIRFAEGVTGTTSGAPAPADLWPRLQRLGLSRLVEVYGSTETAGIAWRDDPAQPFALLEHLVPAPPDAVRRRRDDAELALPDRVEWAGERQLRPSGRRDSAVQVGGVNVFPARVAETLLSHPAVHDCAVRLDPNSGRLKAFVVPGTEAPERLNETLTAFCTDMFSAPERPTMFTFGSSLPRTAMGKLTDWA